MTEGWEIDSMVNWKLCLPTQVPLHHSGSVQDGCHENKSLFWGALIKNVWEHWWIRANIALFTWICPLLHHKLSMVHSKEKHYLKKGGYSLCSLCCIPMLRVLSVTYYVAKTWNYTTGTICMDIKTQWWPSNPMAGHFIHSGNNLSALFLFYFGKTLLKCGPQGDKYKNTAQKKGFQYTRWIFFFPKPDSKQNKNYKLHIWNIVLVF